MPSSRREIISTVISLGCASGFASITPVAFARAPISAPSSPMILTRRQERSLRGGASIKVTRSWRLGFTSQNDQISIAGGQMDVSVEAPPSLASIATIERNRSTREMWPILLSHNGRIISAGADVQERDFASAVQAGGAIIRSERGDLQSEEARLEYLGRLQNISASLMENLPEDLFVPNGRPTFSRQNVDLPDGLKGEIELVYNALPSPQTGWLDRAERRVTTRIGTTEKYVLEEWTLSEA